MKRTDLRRARKRVGLTQRELAARSGVVQPVISDIERGNTRSPHFKTVMALAKALNIDPASLRFGHREGVTP